MRTLISHYFIVADKICKLNKIKNISPLWIYFISSSLFENLLWP